MTKSNQESWINELYRWADENNVAELEYYEDIFEDDNGEMVEDGFWVGLPRDIEVLLDLKELNLSWHNCLEIPVQIRHLTKLKKLSFAKQPTGLQPTFFNTGDGPNKITQIPSWISELVNLEFLDLSGNEIGIVPKSICKLKNLKELYLHDNEIVLIARSLGQLDNLEVLWIHENNLYGFKHKLEKLGELDGVEDPDELQELLLFHGNMLNALTDNIIQLKNLKNLWFDSSNGPIKSRPEVWHKFFSKLQAQVPLKNDELWVQELLRWANDNGIGFLHIPDTPESLLSLSELELNSKNLKYLPDAFSKLNNVKKLSISQNQFDTIPIQIRRLVKLTSLSINECQLICLPEWVSKLVNLEDLCLYSNRLTKVPDGLSKLENLSSLNLDGNKINDLPGTIKSLAKLDSLFLGDNKLTSVPGVISELKRLTYLDLSHNTISSLPNTIKNLTNLEFLSLGYNNLTTLQRELGNLEKLEILNLGNNEISCLPDSMQNLSNLSSLQLQNNRLVSLPKWSSELKELTYLNVIGNQMTRLPDCIKNLPKLINLSLDGYNLPSLLDQLCELDSLDSLTLNINDVYELICSLNKYTNYHRLTVKNLTLRLPHIGYVKLLSDEHKRHIKELIPGSTIFFSYNSI